MASIKNLKKDINYVLGDVIGACQAWELENPKSEKKGSQAIIDETIECFNELMNKVHQKKIENKKEHFRSVYSSLEKAATTLISKVNKL